ncbi:hypothetical protein [Cryptosporangium aurantiacum]|uniref:Uncharacterized protein n=1 Tax=Cryptosporangium aurantiacum TaxID=134849 RepID=A0A1M7TZE4_9ACTN|nr:hypothetical protein [Cryptosporangium aurantiacum]SHN76084.1 hypothetical protein SAMN05443668_107447 [Cryptosporangium aurantiacum]
MRFDGPVPDVRTLEAHAAQISTVRLRLAAVGSACRELRWDDASFGSLSGWIADALERVTVRQAELVEYVAENFALFADDLWDSVAARETIADDPVPAPVVIRSPQILQRSPAQYAHLHARITDGEWIDPALTPLLPGVPLPTRDMLLSADPLAVLPARGLDWTTSYVDPVRGVLRGLTGYPVVVAAQAAALHGTAADLHAVRSDLQRTLRPVLAWPGRDVDQYLGLMTHNLDAIAGLVGTATAIALCAEAAQALVAAVRGHVQERAAALADQVVRLADDADSPAHAVPALTVAVAECHRHALRQVAALVSSLTDLAELVER